MPDIVVHGASSFLGRHFSKRLINDGIPFTILARHYSDIKFAENKPGVSVVRYENSLFEIDISFLSVTAPTFFEFSWNGVFGSQRNSPEQLSVNIPLIISSIELAHQLNAKHWIGFGSQAEYGNLDKKIIETDPNYPVTLYGKSKLICSKISEELCSTYGINHSWLRLFSVYGPDDNHEWLIQYLIKKMFTNSSIDVTKGEQTWDYLYVEDIVEMLIKLMYSKGCGIANLGSGSSFKVKDIILLLKELTSSSSIINFGAIPYRADQVMTMESDITRLKSIVDWSPTTSLREGLKKTIDTLKSKVTF